MLMLMLTSVKNVNTDLDFIPEQNLDLEKKKYTFLKHLFMFINSFEKNQGAELDFFLIWVRLTIQDVNRNAFIEKILI